MSLRSSEQCCSGAATRRNAAPANSLQPEVALYTVNVDGHSRNANTVAFRQMSQDCKTARLLRYSENIVKVYIRPQSFSEVLIIMQFMPLACTRHDRTPYAFECDVISAKVFFTHSAVIVQ